jgi:hypothetical protein
MVWGGCWHFVQVLQPTGLASSSTTESTQIALTPPVLPAPHFPKTQQHPTTTALIYTDNNNSSKEPSF